MFDNIVTDIVTDVFFNLTLNIDEEAGDNLSSLILDFGVNEYKMAVEI